MSMEYINNRVLSIPRVLINLIDQNRYTYEDIILLPGTWDACRLFQIHLNSRELGEQGFILENLC